MPVVTAICPCIGSLATGVTLDVHGQKKGLNLISYIAGDFASGKGQIDPVVETWMSEVAALDKMYQMQEDEWRAKKRAAKAEQHRCQPRRATGQHRGQARFLVYARGRHGGAEVEIGDERLFGDATTELRRHQV